MSKFVIFAGARTGSTSLAKVLGASVDVKMAIEPFHPGFPEWNPGEKKYSELIMDTKSMDESLNELFDKYSAIKVLDYQFPTEIYYAMLGRSDLKILFLRRKNLYQGALSNYVAEQTDLWQKGKNEEAYQKLKPISPDDISKWVSYIGMMNQAYAKFLEENREGEFFPLFYEQLYSENFEINKRNLAVICKFFDISLPPDAAIKEHMTPSNAKINYNNIYKQVPNFKELEEKFGKVF